MTALMLPIQRKPLSPTWSMSTLTRFALRGWPLVAVLWVLAAASPASCSPKAGTEAQAQQEGSPVLGRRLLQVVPAVVLPRLRPPPITPDQVGPAILNVHLRP